MKKKKIIWQLFPSYLLVTLLALAAVTFSYSKDIKKFFLDHTAIELESRAHLILPQIKTLLATGRYGDINQVVNIQAENTGTRITIILPTGEVIGDSRENPATMDGHAGRPEIAKALGGATGTSTRYSKTLQKDMMYVAIPVKFEKIVKGVIRTSVPVSNIDKKLADIEKVTVELTHQSPYTLLMMRVVEIGLPVLLSLFSIFFVFRYSLTEKRSHEIKELLKQRNLAREQAEKESD